MKVSVLGAGAFGTALAIALSDDDCPVMLWDRIADRAKEIAETRRSPRLPDVEIPETVAVTSDLVEAQSADAILLAIPAQTLTDVLQSARSGFMGKVLVACCKGIEIDTLRGPVSMIDAAVPDVTSAILTGPSFASDIARGMPTALTLACTDKNTQKALQQRLSMGALRIYRTGDVIGAELGGALKNVVAIACGAAMGAGFGESSRAAVMTRGFAEMQRMAHALGADPRTLQGLSGFGDLALTCTSPQSRNYRHGLDIGAGRRPDLSKTVEGVATAQALLRIAKEREIDLPIAHVVAHMTAGELDATGALAMLLDRPLKKE